MTTTTRRALARRSITTVVLGAAAGSALLFAVPGTALAAGSESATSSVGDAEKSIVLIGIEWEGYVQYPTRTGQWRWSEPIQVTSSCTGWFASEQGHIVTAGHCVEPEQVETDVLGAFLAQQGLDLDPAQLDWPVEGRGDHVSPDLTGVWAVQPSAVEGAVLEDPLTAHVIDWQPFDNGDLALLQVDNLPEPTPALTVASDPPSVGDEVTAIGYPGNVGSVSDAARLRASFKSGTVSSTQVSHEGVARTEVNAEIGSGMSGGPTVDEDGAVLGVNSAGFDNQAFNFITDHAALVAFLDHHDVEASAAGHDTLTSDAGQPVPASSSQPSGSSTALLAAAGGALAAAAGGTFLFGRRRPAPAPASASVGRAAAGRVDATRFVGLPTWIPPRGTGAARGPACSHRGSAPGGGYCRDCGTRLG
ncbi:trypsin-like peptidase domain-containing protein [Geodermatophilus sp. SYSU D01176]